MAARPHGLEDMDMDLHPVDAAPLTRLTPYIGEARVRATGDDLSRLATALAGRRLVVVTGDDRRKGGVYELLRSLLPYLAGAGITVAWTNIATHPDARPALEFFHVLAHGHPPSAQWSGDLVNHRDRLRTFGTDGAAQLIPHLASSDVVFAHDTQTALFAAAMKHQGWPVIWHSHIGTSVHNDLTDGYWRVFGDALAGIDRCIFYLDGYIPDVLRHNAVCALPSVDPSTPKNAVRAVTDARAVLHGYARASALTGRSDTITAESLVAVQVSRWDKLKDMRGVCAAFRRVAERRDDFHGMVVGTVAQSANERVELDSCLQVVQAADASIATRLHVWSVPASGTREHDDTISAVQSAADIIVQKSLQEGFGLTVTEAMLKAKPVIATAVGAIPTQIQHGQNGILLGDNSDPAELATTVLTLANDPDGRARLGTVAQADARRHFTSDVQLRALAHHLSAALADTALG